MLLSLCIYDSCCVNMLDCAPCSFCICRTSERRGLVEGAVLVVEVGGAVAGAEDRGGGQDQLLFDDAGLGMVLRQL